MPIQEAGIGSSGWSSTAIALEAARSLYRKAARKSEPEAAMAKVTGSRVAVDVARDAIQVHGGYGTISPSGCRR